MPGESSTVTFYIGIDLGTTNSLVARASDGAEVDVLTTRDMEILMPSVVSLPPRATRVEAGQVLVGRQALNNARRDPKNTIRSIKRLMGMPSGAPKTEITRGQLAFEVLPDPARDGMLVVKLGESLLTPEEVSGHILRRLKEDAENVIGASVQEAVITVPAHFLEPQRAATARAAGHAGLRCKALLDEPTAAALSEFSGDTTRERANILVFDFGGGTLDISWVIRSGRDFQVRAYTGDNFLGGDDIDRALASVIEDHLLSAGGIVEATNHRLAFSLKEHAESAKRVLSSGSPQALVLIPAACKDAQGDLIDVDMEISQEQFARVLAPFEDRVRKLMQDLLTRESLSPEMFTDVLMVGGSSAIPAFRKLLEGIFERDGQRRVRLSRTPMEAVARGAAIYSSMIKGLKCPKRDCGAENPIDSLECVVCGTQLQTAALAFDEDQGAVYSYLPESLGVRYRKGEDADLFQRILEKGMAYPTQTPKVEQFMVPSTDGFVVDIYTGDGLKASANDLISVLSVEAIPPDVKAGDPVLVEFAYTRDRTLFISLRFPTSRSKYHPRWKLDAPTRGKGSGRGDSDPFDDLTQILPRIRGFLQEYGDLIDEGTRRKLRDDMAAAESAVTGGSREDAQRLAQVLNAALFYGSGVASTLFLAERTIAGDDPDLGPEIREKAEALREVARRKAPEKELCRRELEELVISVFQKKLPQRMNRDSMAGDTTLYR